MASKFRVFAAFAWLACSLAASSALGNEVAQSVAYHPDSVCEITGTVMELKNVERSPWTDGTPSTLSVYETHISIAIANRKPHSKAAPAESPCNVALKKDEQLTYRVCSNTPVKKGDRVTATEGGSTGSARISRCLFDIVVLPGKTENTTENN